MPCLIDVFYAGGETLPHEVWVKYNTAYFCGDIEVAAEPGIGDEICVCESSELTLRVYSVRHDPEPSIRFVWSTDSWAEYTLMCKALFECGFDAPILGEDEEFWK